MVIDVDDEEAIQAADAGPAEVAALHDDRGVVLLGDAVGNLDRRHARKLQQGSRRPVLVDDVDVLAEGAEGERHRQLRADRIAVRPAVRRDDEALPLADGLDDAKEFRTTTARHLPYAAR